MEQPGGENMGELSAQGDEIMGGRRPRKRKRAAILVPRVRRVGRHGQRSVVIHPILEVGLSRLPTMAMD